jgi:hypothetical protein
MLLAIANLNPSDIIGSWLYQEADGPRKGSFPPVFFPIATPSFKPDSADSGHDWRKVSCHKPKRFPFAPT